MSFFKKVRDFVLELWRPIWGFAAGILALVIMVGIWVIDARVLNNGFDFNLGVIKLASNYWDVVNSAYQLVPVMRPGQVEAAARAISGEKLLLNMELALIIRYFPIIVKWTVIALVVWPFRFFRWIARRRRAKKAAAAAVAAPTGRPVLTLVRQRTA